MVEAEPVMAMFGLRVHGGDVTALGGGVGGEFRQLIHEPLVSVSNLTRPPTPIRPKRHHRFGFGWGGDVLTFQECAEHTEAGGGGAGCQR